MNRSVGAFLGHFLRRPSGEQEEEDKDVANKSGDEEEESDDWDSDEDEESEGGDDEDDDDDDGDDDEADIQKPKRSARQQVESGDDDSDSSHEIDAERCPVCLKRITSQQLGSPESCDHTFCLLCIEEWAKNVNTCPVDRSVFHMIFIRKTLGGPICGKIQVEDKHNIDVAAAEEEPTWCEICAECDREDQMLLCDGCDLGYHLDCLTPALKDVPTGEWFCPDCIEAGQIPAELHTDTQSSPQIPGLSGQSAANITSKTSIRSVPRTRFSERIRERILERQLLEESPSEGEEEEEEAAAEEEKNDIVSQGAGSTSAKPKQKRKTTPRKRKTGTRKRKSTSKRKRAGGRKRKGRRRQRKGKTRKRKSGKKIIDRDRLRQLRDTVKKRIANKLGLSKPPPGRSIPLVKKQATRSLENQRIDIGVTSLNILGHSLYTEFSEDSNEEKAINKSSPKQQNKEKKVSEEVSVNQQAHRGRGVGDLLGSILSDQSLLHMDSKNIQISRDGSLGAKSPAQLNSSLQKAGINQLKATDVSSPTGGPKEIAMPIASTDKLIPLSPPPGFNAFVRFPPPLMSQFAIRNEMPSLRMPVRFDLNRARPPRPDIPLSMPRFPAQVLPEASPRQLLPHEPKSKDGPKWRHGAPPLEAPLYSSDIDERLGSHIRLSPQSTKFQAVPPPSRDTNSSMPPPLMGERHVGSVPSSESLNSASTDTDDRLRNFLKQPLGMRDLNAPPPSLMGADLKTASSPMNELPVGTVGSGPSFTDIDDRLGGTLKQPPAKRELNAPPPLMGDRPFSSQPLNSSPNLGNIPLPSETAFSSDVDERVGKSRPVCLIPLPDTRGPQPVPPPLMALEVNSSEKGHLSNADKILEDMSKQLQKNKFEKFGETSFLAGRTSAPLENVPGLFSDITASRVGIVSEPSCIFSSMPDVTLQEKSRLSNTDKILEDVAKGLKNMKNIGRELESASGISSIPLPLSQTQGRFNAVPPSLLPELTNSANILPPLRQDDTPTSKPYNVIPPLHELLRQKEEEKMSVLEINSSASQPVEQFNTTSERTTYNAVPPPQSGYFGVPPAVGEASSEPSYFGVQPPIVPIGEIAPQPGYFGVPPPTTVSVSNTMPQQGYVGVPPPPNISCGETLPTSGHFGAVSLPPSAQSEPATYNAVPPPPMSSETTIGTNAPIQFFGVPPPTLPDAPPPPLGIIPLPPTVRPPGLPPFPPSQETTVSAVQPPPPSEPPPPLPPPVPGVPPPPPPSSDSTEKPPNSSRSDIQNAFHSISSSVLDEIPMPEEPKTLTRSDRKMIQKKKDTSISKPKKAGSNSANDSNSKSEPSATEKIRFMLGKPRSLERKNIFVTGEPKASKESSKQAKTATAEVVYGPENRPDIEKDDSTKGNASVNHKPVSEESSKSSLHEEETGILVVPKITTDLAKTTTEDKSDDGSELIQVDSSPEDQSSEAFSALPQRTQAKKIKLKRGGPAITVTKNKISVPDKSGNISAPNEQQIGERGQVGKDSCSESVKEKTGEMSDVSEGEDDQTFSNVVIKTEKVDEPAPATADDSDIEEIPQETEKDVEQESGEEAEDSEATNESEEEENEEAEGEEEDEGEEDVSDEEEEEESESEAEEESGSEKDAAESSVIESGDEEDAQDEERQDSVEEGELADTVLPSKQLPQQSNLRKLKEHVNREEADPLLHQPTALPDGYTTNNEETVDVWRDVNIGKIDDRNYRGRKKKDKGGDESSKKKKDKRRGKKKKHSKSQPGQLETTNDTSDKHIDRTQKSPSVEIVRVSYRQERARTISLGPDDTPPRSRSRSISLSSSRENRRNRSESIRSRSRGRQRHHSERRWRRSVERSDSRRRRSRDRWRTARRFSESRMRSSLSRKHRSVSRERHSPLRLGRSWGRRSISWGRRSLSRDLAVDREMRSVSRNRRSRSRARKMINRIMAEANAARPRAVSPVVNWSPPREHSRNRNRRHSPIGRERRISYRAEDETVLEENRTSHERERRKASRKHREETDYEDVSPEREDLRNKLHRRQNKENRSSSRRRHGSEPHADEDEDVSAEQRHHRRKRKHRDVEQNVEEADASHEKQERRRKKKRRREQKENIEEPSPSTRERRKKRKRRRHDTETEEITPEKKDRSRNRRHRKDTEEQLYNFDEYRDENADYLQSHSQEEAEPLEREHRKRRKRRHRTEDVDEPAEEPASNMDYMRTSSQEREKSKRDKRRHRKERSEVEEHEQREDVQLYAIPARRRERQLEKILQTREEEKRREKEEQEEIAKLEELIRKAEEEEREQMRLEKERERKLLQERREQEIRLQQEEARQHEIISSSEEYSDDEAREAAAKRSATDRRVKELSRRLAERRRQEQVSRMVTAELLIDPDGRLRPTRSQPFPDAKNIRVLCAFNSDGKPTLDAEVPTVILDENQLQEKDKSEPEEGEAISDAEEPTASDALVIDDKSKTPTHEIAAADVERIPESATANEVEVASPETPIAPEYDPFQPTQSPSHEAENNDEKQEEAEKEKENISQDIASPVDNDDADQNEKEQELEVETPSSAEKSKSPAVADEQPASFKLSLPLPPSSLPPPNLMFSAPSKDVFESSVPPAVKVVEKPSKTLMTASVQTLPTTSSSDTSPSANSFSASLARIATLLNAPLSTSLKPSVRSNILKQPSVIPKKFTSPVVKKVHASPDLDSPYEPLDSPVGSFTFTSKSSKLNSFGGKISHSHKNRMGDKINGERFSKIDMNQFDAPVFRDTSFDMIATEKEKEEMPLSAVDMDNKQRYLEKKLRQERVVEEVKLALKPYYNKREVDKDEYKDIMRKCVPKICHNKTGDINPAKISLMIQRYVQNLKKRRKHEIKKALGLVTDKVQKVKR